MPNSPTGQVGLGAAKYVAVTSYRQDGTPVSTPVWVVQDGSDLAVWTPKDSFKVKRIRRNPAITVAPCTFGGEPLGPAVPGRAEIMDDAGRDRVRSLIKRKYGLVGWLTVTGSQLRHGAAGTVGVRIELDPAKN